jgi:hypothetical protein
MKVVDKTPGVVLSSEMIVDQKRTDLDKDFDTHAQDVLEAAEQLIKELNVKPTENN